MNRSSQGGPASRSFGTYEPKLARRLPAMSSEPRQPRRASAQRRLSGGAIVVTIALFVCLTAAQSAAAGQIVWNKGDSAIWAVNDDGSDQHQPTGRPAGGVGKVCMPRTAPH